MKKVVNIMLSVLICFCLVACGNNKKYAIDNYTWVMSTIQSIEENGDFVAYALSDDTFNKNDYPNAVSVDMTCNAKDGSLSIIDNTHNKTYSGMYKVTNNSSQTTIYEIAIGEKRGTVVVSVTNNQDGTVTPIMILSVGDYALNFKSK